MPILTNVSKLFGAGSGSKSEIFSYREARKKKMSKLNFFLQLLDLILLELDKLVLSFSELNSI